MQWRKISTAQTRNIIALVIAAVGLLLVFAMSMIYRVPTIPAWDTIATPISFFVTTFLLGTLAIGAAFVATYWFMGRQENLKDKETQFDILATTLRWMALLSIALLGVQFVVIPLYLGSLAAQGSSAATTSLLYIMDGNGVLLALRLVLLFLGAGIFTLFVYLNATSEAKARIAGNLALAAFAFVLVSEVIGRFLFYASMTRIGL